MTLAQCAIAARHIDHDTELRLRQAADATIVSQIFNPSPSAASIQAILILATWPSSCTLPSNDVKDNRLLIASAVSMANNSQIDQYSTRSVASCGGNILARGMGGEVVLDAPDTTDEGRLVSFM